MNNETNEVSVEDIIRRRLSSAEEIKSRQAASSKKARLLVALWACRKEVKNGILLTKTIIDKYNDEFHENDKRNRITYQQSPKLLFSEFNFERGAIHDGLATMEWDEEYVKRVIRDYGLESLIEDEQEEIS